MTSLNRQDADLHNEDGSHRSTAPSANGSAVERYERRIRRHMDRHLALPLGAPDGSHKRAVVTDRAPYDGAPCRYLSTAGDWCGDCPECETAMLWIHVKLDERDSAEAAGKDGGS